MMASRQYCGKFKTRRGHGASPSALALFLVQARGYARLTSMKKLCDCGWPSEEPAGLGFLFAFVLYKIGIPPRLPLRTPLPCFPRILKRLRSTSSPVQ